MNWFAIFKTGKHTNNSGETKEYKAEDLDRMISKFESGKVPLVIGHPKTNDPAWGWIKSLKRVGDTLYAEAENVVNEFAEMVNKKMFPNRSIAINPDGSLRHVGFLGAVPPAVKGLGEVSFSDSVEPIEIKEFNEPDILELEKLDWKKITNADKKESFQNTMEVQQPKILSVTNNDKITTKESLTELKKRLKAKYKESQENGTNFFNKHR